MKFKISIKMHPGKGINPAEIFGTGNFHHSG